ncbi:hypothetical protein ACLMJK_001052 [Lecanora helva]
MLSSWLAKRASSSFPAPVSIPPSKDFDGNDGPWSSFPIQIGTPPQTVKVLISTASSQTWAVDPQGCQPSDPANCSAARGGFFRPNDSSTWHQNTDVAGGLYPIGLEAYLNNTDNSTNGRYGYDTVALTGQGPGGPKLDQQIVAAIATPNFYLGFLGLDPDSVALPNTNTKIPSLLSNLNSSRLIPSESWSYTAGNQYRPGPAYGSLVLGGYDTSRFQPNDVSYTFNSSSPSGLVVHIGEININTNDVITTVSTDNESIEVTIDSTTPYIILPPTICEQFEETFNITWDDNVQAYLVNDSLHNALLEQDASVDFNLGNALTVPGQGYNITLPYSAFNLTAEAPLLNNPGRYFPLRRASNESQYVLGRAFLQEAYIIADYEHNNFSVSQCAWGVHTESHIVAIHPPGFELQQHNSKNLSGGAIAGIVIGALAAVIIILVLGVLIWRKCRQPKPQKAKQVNDVPAEMDAGEKNPQHFAPDDMRKGYPQSPELDSAVHKGHELAGSPYSETPPTGDGQTYELDATERQSRTLSSPISLLSETSDATRLHQRQPSDPLFPTRAMSDVTRMQRRQSSDPISPMRARSDAERLHKRERSDPVSILSERREQGEGTL